MEQNHFIYRRAYTNDHTPDLEQNHKTTSTTQTNTKQKHTGRMDLFLVILKKGLLVAFAIQRPDSGSLSINSSRNSRSPHCWPFGWLTHPLHWSRRSSDRVSLIWKNLYAAERFRPFFDAASPLASRGLPPSAGCSPLWGTCPKQTSTQQRSNCKDLFLVFVNCKDIHVNVRTAKTIQQRSSRNGLHINVRTAKTTQQRSNCNVRIAQTMRPTRARTRCTKTCLQPTRKHHNYEIVKTIH